MRESVRAETSRAFFDLEDQTDGDYLSVLVCCLSS